MADSYADANKEIAITDDEVPVCTEIRYRVNLNIGEETHSIESQAIQKELDEEWNLATVGNIAIEGIEEGKKMKVTWSDVPCIENYTVTICGVECNEFYVQGSEEMLVVDVDPCTEYTVTMSPYEE